ncbi:polysaccharide lyase family 8 super-sandwich domain-containing protein [Paenibacillus silviterrae]|uniref:beta-xylosidase family glycoside hydrolase n=1 Tax=Paenibacillus silviterrae TaxID=3242194 RepID=UPI0025436017|nr:polysaccharide lyase family 8 super-sandwich domain-containing protein [Paenibacillus chinjuensis]
MVKQARIINSRSLLSKLMIASLLIPSAAQTIPWNETAYAFTETRVPASEYNSDRVSALRNPALSVQAPSDEAAAFALLRSKFFKKITGYDPVAPYDVNNPYVKQTIESIDSRTSKLWSTMNKTDYTWDDLRESSLSETFPLREISNRLRAMAVAYTTYGSAYYKSGTLLQHIVNGLEWFYTNRFNENTTAYGNWYEWEISIPLDLEYTCIMLYDELSQDLKNRLMSAAAVHAPDPYTSPTTGAISTGANRVWKAKAVALRAIVTQDALKMQEASDSLNDVFPYITTTVNTPLQVKDGFYEDGSFIQHEGGPYNGGYGSGLISDISELLWLLSGSIWDNTSPQKSNIYQWDLNAFENVLYKGQFLPSVSGRFTATPAFLKPTSGGAFLLALLTQIEMVDNPYKDIHKSIIKANLKQGYTDLFLQNSIWVTTKYQDILQDPSIPERPEQVGNYQFYNQDRVVHRRPNWLFDVAMHSTRTKSYESIHNVNTKGYYTSDGAAFFFMKPSDYSFNYQYTIDPQRLPGITVDRDPTIPDGAGKHQYAKKDWVGGVSLDGTYGTAGVDYLIHHHPNGKDLSAKKSWFLFDEEVVSLGAGIKSTSGRTIETIVENRFLNSQGNNTLTVDGVQKQSSIGWFEEMKNVKWLHLEDYGGIVFPQATNVKGLREKRTGNLIDVNQTEYSRAFDDFTSGLQEKDWTWIREDKSHYLYTGTTLDITIQPGTLEGATNTAKNVLVAQAPPQDFYAETKLTFTPSAFGQEAGIILYMNDDNYVSISRGLVNGGPGTIVASERNGLRLTRTFPDSGESPVYLKIEKTGSQYSFYLSKDGENWGSTLSSVSNDMSGSEANDKLFMGLFAQGGYEASVPETVASFDYFRFWSTASYLPLWIDHGVNPQNGTYSYITLPNQTTEEVNQYSSNPDIEIIQNDTTIQAVREKSLGIVAAHFWNAGTVDLITSPQPAAIMTGTKEGSFTVSASDPTHKQASLRVEINKPGLSVLHKDPTVAVVQMSPTIILNIDTSNSLGKTHKITFSTDDTAPAPIEVTIPQTKDFFDDATLNGTWSWVREDSTNWNLAERPGHLRMKTTNGDIWFANSNQKNILLQAIPYTNYEMETKLDFHPTKNNQSAGLIVYQDDDHYLKVSRSYTNGNIYSFTKEIAGKGTNQTIADPIPVTLSVYTTPVTSSVYANQTTSDSMSVTASVYLKLSKEGTTYSAYYSTDRINWTIIGSPYKDVTLTAAKAGLHAMHSSTAPSIPADFDYFVAKPFAAHGNDTFNAPTLGDQWKWVREDSNAWSLTSSPGSLRIATQSGDIWFAGNTQKNILVQQPQSNDFEITTKLTFNPTQNNQAAGLIVYGDDDNYLNLSRSFSGGKGFVFIKEIAGQGSKQTAVDTMGDYVYFRLTKSDNTYTAYYSGDGLNWVQVGTPYKNVSIGNPKVGLHAMHSGSAPGMNADFDYVTLSSFHKENGSTSFAGTSVDPNWSWVREDSSMWSLSAKPDSMRITAQDGNLWAATNNQKNILLQQPQTDSNFEVETKLSFDARGDEQAAGLIVYTDDQNYVKLDRYYSESGDVAETFNSSTLDTSWSWVRQDAAKWSLTANSGKMRITTQSGDIWYAGNTQKNILLRTPPFTDFDITTRLTFTPTQNNQAAGLIIYQDDDNYIKLNRSYSNGKFLVFSKEIAGAASKQTVEDSVMSDTISLRLTKLGTTITAFYSVDGIEWTQVGTAFTDVVLVNSKVGLNAMHSSSALSINADFDSFDITRKYAKSFALITEVKGVASIQSFGDPVTGPVYLKLAKAGNEYSAFYSSDGRTWHVLGIAKGIAIPNPKIGIQARHGNVIQPMLQADFDYVKVKY